jgi:predicted metal-dependent HD superfamily phosphohydrolase
MSAAQETMRDPLRDHKSPNAIHGVRLDATLARLGPQVLAAARAAYASPGRHYHSWKHVEGCFEEAAGMRFDDPLTLHAALLFHDAVYVAGAKDNEARSAKLAAELLRAHTQFRDTQIARVEQLIMLTANHAALPAGAPRDDALLVDIDLGILATPAAVYDRYAENVRLEWVPGVVNDAQYRAGRGDFLRRTLAAPRIFHSDAFAAREAVARGNLARELAALGK